MQLKIEKIIMSGNRYLLSKSVVEVDIVCFLSDFAWSIQGETLLNVTTHYQLWLFFKSSDSI